MTDIAHGDDWNRTIGAMSVPMYCDWVLAKRPGFSPKNNLELQSWCKTWRIKNHARLVAKAKESQSDVSR